MNVCRNLEFYVQSSAQSTVDTISIVMKAPLGGIKENFSRWLEKGNEENLLDSRTGLKDSSNYSKIRICVINVTQLMLDVVFMVRVPRYGSFSNPG